MRCARRCTASGPSFGLTLASVRLAGLKSRSYPKRQGCFAGGCDLSEAGPTAPACVRVGLVGAGSSGRGEPLGASRSERGVVCAPLQSSNPIQLARLAESGIVDFR